MKIGQALKMALKSILGNKGRSALTMVGRAFKLPESPAALTYADTAGIESYAAGYLATM